MVDFANLGPLLLPQGFILFQ